MQVTKDYIKSDIMKAAGDLFLEKGFLKVSMREIAARSNVGLSNIYNYFKSKDEIFCRIVGPAMKDFDRMLDEHHGRRGMDIMDMRDTTYLEYVVREYTDYIRRHRRLLTLLFFKAQGSSLENYKKDFTTRATTLVKEYFTKMKERHPQIDVDISDFSIHMHTIWIFAMFEELIVHDISPGELEKVISEYLTMEVAGWRELMKI